MKKSEFLQALVDWTGDAGSLLLEMKRRAGVETDGQLAAVLGRDQSAVSHWRRKGAVPESVLLGFEEAIQRNRSVDTARALAARAVTMRLADFMFDENRRGSATASRFVAYMTVASCFHSIVDAVYKSMSALDADRSPTELAELLLEDQGYLKGLASWARALPAGTAFAREALSPPAICLPPLPTGPQKGPQSGPQSSKQKGRRRPLS